MNTSINNIFNENFYNTSSIELASTNLDYHPNISQINLNAINLIKSYESLQENWDSYGAETPSVIAMQKAVTFILWLSKYNIDAFFVAPSPNGNIVVEIKQNNANVEFEFTQDSDDNICASQNENFISEAILNDTTKISYIKWLICPNGDCPPSFR